MVRTTPHDLPPAEGEPLYRRIATELLGEPRDGTIPPGERLPGERRLAGHFGVSPETVRQALDLLRHDGLVATDRRGSHATLPGLPVETPASLTFPVGARAATPGSAARATVTREAPPAGPRQGPGTDPRPPDLDPPRRHHPSREHPVGAGHPAGARPVRAPAGDHRPRRGRPTGRPCPRVHPSGPAVRSAAAGSPQARADGRRSLVRRTADAGSRR